MCRMLCCVTLDLYKQRVKPDLANILKQSLQNGSPFVNKQFAHGFYTDLTTG